MSAELLTAEGMPRFGSMPLWVHSIDLSDSAVCTLHVLFSFVAGGGEPVAWPSIATLEGLRKRSRSAIKRNLAELAEKGVITRRRRFDDNGRETSAMVVLHWNQPADLTPPDGREGSGGEPGRGSAVNRGEGFRSEPQKKPDMKKPLNTLPTTSSSADSEAASGQREDGAVSERSEKVPGRKRNETFDAVHDMLTAFGFADPPPGLVMELAKRARSTGREPQFVTELAVRMARVEKVNLVCCTVKERSRVLGAVTQVAGVCDDMAEIARRAGLARKAGERSVAYALANNWCRYEDATVIQKTAGKTEASLNTLASEVVATGALRPLRERVVGRAAAQGMAVGAARQPLAIDVRSEVRHG